jgi:phosphatidylserine/phosphatidylglycerophosphate/cardiolipin synthase-like enzyme
VKRRIRTFVAGGLLALALGGPARATSPDVRLEIHYSPEERLDRIDADLIATATTSIDLASYSLTDSIVIDALEAAAHRGVKIRIALDPRERHDFVRFGDLADTVRIKRGGPFMHLKAYEIDGATLRTGSANFSSSGENAQDNDLIVIRGGDSAGAFEAHFERMWRVAQPMIEFAPAIDALEPH